MKKRFLAVALIFAVLLSFGIYFTVNAQDGDTIDKSALIAAIVSYKDYDGAEYTADSWAAFKSAFNNALSVYNNENATAADVAGALDSLIGAAKGLKKITDTPPVYYPTVPAGVVNPPPAATEPTSAPTPPTPAVIYGSKTTEETTTEEVTTEMTTEEITNPETPLADIYVSPFTDFDETAWFASAVHIMDQRGLMGGDSDEYTFSPDKAADRYTLAEILYHLAGKPELSADAKLKFKDVNDKSYADAVIWASEKGLMKGFEDGNFRGNEPLTIEQIAVVLYRYANMLKLDVSAKADLSKYSDADKISDWAIDAMQWAIAVGLTNVNGSNLAPDKIATRSETAAIVAKFLTEVIEVKN